MFASNSVVSNQVSLKNEDEEGAKNKRKIDFLFL